MCPRRPESTVTRFVEFFLELFSRSCTVREIDSADLIQVLKLESRRRPLGTTSYGLPVPDQAALPISNIKPHGGSYQISDVLWFERSPVRRIAAGLKEIPSGGGHARLLSPVNISSIPGTIATSTVTATSRPRGNPEFSLIVSDRSTG